MTFVLTSKSTNSSHTAVLSSKGSADITQSDLGDEIPAKTTKETPMVGRNSLLASAISITSMTNTQNGESISTPHYSYKKEVKDNSFWDKMIIHVCCVLFRMLT